MVRQKETRDSPGRRPQRHGGRMRHRARTFKAAHMWLVALALENQQLLRTDQTLRLDLKSRGLDAFIERDWPDCDHARSIGGTVDILADWFVSERPVRRQHVQVHRLVRLTFGSKLRATFRSTKSILIGST